jgi:hypothetical protein
VKVNAVVTEVDAKSPIRDPSPTSASVEHRGVIIMLILRFEMRGQRWRLKCCSYKRKCITGKGGLVPIIRVVLPERQIRPSYTSHEVSMKYGP